MRVPVCSPMVLRDLQKRHSEMIAAAPMKVARMMSSGEGIVLVMMRGDDGNVRRRWKYTQGLCDESATICREEGSIVEKW